MRVIIKGIMMVILISGLIMTAAAEKIEFSGDVAVVSDYVWRGQLCDDDPSIQTGLYAAGYGLLLGLWTSYPLDGEDSVNCEEVDYTIEYGKSFDKLNLAVGYIYYDFSNAGNIYATEVYGKIGMDFIGSPSVTYYYDFTDQDNTKSYVSIEGSHSIGLISLGGHVGLYSDGAGSDIGFSVGYDYEREKSTITPMISCSIPSGQLADAQDVKVYGGVTIAFGL